MTDVLPLFPSFLPPSLPPSIVHVSKQIIATCIHTAYEQLEDGA